MVVTGQRVDVDETCGADFPTDVTVARMEAAAADGKIVPPDTEPIGENCAMETDAWRVERRWAGMVRVEDFFGRFRRPTCEKAAGAARQCR